jgi:predicted ribosome quality control (RQC) complex YloA/Tae2 family protein
VSNAIRYDSLLVRELARALDRAWRGARVEGVWLDRDRLRFTLLARPRRRGEPAPSLLWQLHPASGHLTPAPGAPAGARVPLSPGAAVVGVRSPPDERVIIIELQPAARVVIELIANQWNALVTGADDRIVAVLRDRVTRGRALRAGAPYPPVRPSDRAGADGTVLPLPVWLEHLGAVPPAARPGELVRLAAYASPLNAAWILGDAAVSASPLALERAWDRYTALVASADLQPVMMADERGVQPYVVAGGGGAEASLLDLFAEAARRAGATPAGGIDVEGALAAVARRQEAVQRRVERLRAEQLGASDEARRLRASADLLLAHLHQVPRGAAQVELPGPDGGICVIDLDPSRRPADNAARLYDAARRRDRAAQRIPALLRRAQDELMQLEAAAARVRDGTATADELARLQRLEPAAASATAPTLPYREYRTSRGLEVRVGRGSRANDDLTFRHSSPDDIWLHARDVAGAHVILRWPHAASNPPAADIAEAAGLAALHSRARTSGTVAVDWTRRKYVRKPRKSGSGLVLPERVRTVFVAPDPMLEERMRVD